MNSPSSKPLTLTPRTKPLAGSTDVSAGIAVMHTFFNHTGMDIEMIDRLGVRATLPTSGEYRTENELIIRISYRFSHPVYQRLNTALQRKEAKESKALKILADSLVPERPGGKFYTCSIEYPVTLAQLQALGGEAYVVDLDLVVKIPNGVDSYHPYGEEGRLLFSSNEPVVSSTVRCEYVRNSLDQGVPCLFQRINGNVRRVHPLQDVSREDGVYIRIDDCLSSADAAGTTFTACVDIDDIDTLQRYDLYHSFNQAKDGTDVDVINKLKLAELEHTIVEAKRRNDLQSQELETLKTEQKRNLLQVEEEARQREAEAKERDRILKENQALRDEQKNLRAHQLEMKSMERKETVEVTKYVPQLILGAIGLLGTIIALAK